MEAKDNSVRLLSVGASKHHNSVSNPRNSTELAQTPPNKPININDDIKLPELDILISQEINLNDSVLLDKYVSKQLKKKKTIRNGSNQSNPENTKCKIEFIAIIATWLSFGMVTAINIIPSNTFAHSKTTIQGYYDKYQLSITPAKWNYFQWSAVFVLQALSLTYLTVISVQYNTHFLGPIFYLGIFCANCFQTIWIFVTLYEYFFASSFCFLFMVIALIISNYILLRHIFYKYNVTAITQGSLRTIKTGIGSYNQSTTTFGTPKSLNPSAAAKWIYQETEKNEIKTEIEKIRELTKLKYIGLIGLVFNTVTMHLTSAIFELYFEIGILMRYELNVENNSPPFIVLTLISITMIIYEYIDIFSKYQRLFEYNYATHIIFVNTFTAIVNRHLINDKESGAIFAFILMLLAWIVLFIKIFRIIKLIIKIKKENTNNYERILN